MSDDPVSLGLLQTLIQRVLDSQTMMRDDNRNMRRRLGRIDHRLSAIERSVQALQGDATDDADYDARLQDQLDELTTRIERLEKP